MHQELVIATAIANERARERQRQIELQLHKKAMKLVYPGQIERVTWFGGVKATAQFLADNARLAFAQSRLATAVG